MTTFYCPHCSAQVQLVIDKSHEYGAPEDGPREKAVFGHCAACYRPALLHFSGTGGCDQWNEEIFEFDAQLYPAATQLLDSALPLRVHESYREALQCVSAKAWLAAAVMVRRTLEAIGQEFDPTTRRLFDGLAAMRKSGIISEELWNWGEQLRFLGNTGAHPTGDRVSADDAKDALDFLNAIIHNIYVLRPRFKTMLARRSGPGAAAPVDAG